MSISINVHPGLGEVMMRAGVEEWAVGILPGEIFRRSGDSLVICALFPYALPPKPRRDGARSYVEHFAYGSDYHVEVTRALERLLVELSCSDYYFLAGSKRGDVDLSKCEQQSRLKIKEFSEGIITELCVDNSGYDDRLVAESLGVGKRGKNGLIINRRYGTAHFIGYIVVTPKEHAGTGGPSLNWGRVNELLKEGEALGTELLCEGCDRCLRACPSGALGGDFYRCISLVTQSGTDISEDIRDIMRDNLYGCTVCQMACPHNETARKWGQKMRMNPASEEDSKEQSVLVMPKSPLPAPAGDGYVDPYELLAYSNKEFKKRFGHMGFAWRPAWIYKRNAVINIGNTGDMGDFEKLSKLLETAPDKLVQYIEWAKLKIYNRRGGISKTMRASDKFFQEKIQGLKDEGVYRKLPVMSGPSKAEIVLDGKKVINLSSNNYLGLATHPKLIEATKKTADEYGAGAGAVRTIVANTDLLENLEKQLAEFKREEAVCVYQSGFNCNAGTIQAITEKGDLIISDELNHASIIDGVRLSKADKAVFKHSDMADLERVLKEKRGDHKNCLIITDGVFSMDGDIAKLPEIVALAEKYNCMTYVDDAHGSGVLGENGRGTVDHFHLHGKVDFVIGTLSKAIGVVGGYVAGSALMKDWLLHRGRPILFSTALTPPSIAAISASIELLSNSSEFTERLWDNAKYFKEQLGKYGFNTGHSETPITPVIIGEEAKSLEFSKKLMENGVFVSAIVFPTVPRGTGRVRCMVTAGHTKEQLDRAVAAFAKVGKEMGIIK